MPPNHSDNGTTKASEQIIMRECRQRLAAAAAVLMDGRLVAAHLAVHYGREIQSHSSCSF